MAGKLRISGGNLVRRQFETPALADQGLVRPATDRVRQAIFSSLGSEVVGANVLDLFGGSGAYSFESVSRGAVRSTIIEKTRGTAECIERNIKTLGLTEQCKLIVTDALVFVQGNPEAYDLIFVDPPYTLHLDAEFWRNLARFTHEDSVVVYRCFKKVENGFAGLFEVTRDRNYGNTRVYFLNPLLS